MNKIYLVYPDAALWNINTWGCGHHEITTRVYTLQIPHVACVTSRCCDRRTSRCKKILGTVHSSRVILIQGPCQPYLYRSDFIHLQFRSHDFYYISFAFYVLFNLGKPSHIFKGYIVDNDYTFQSASAGILFPIIRLKTFTVIIKYFCSPSPSVFISPAHKFDLIPRYTLGSTSFRYIPSSWSKLRNKV